MELATPVQKTVSSNRQNTAYEPHDNPIDQKTYSDRKPNNAEFILKAARDLAPRIHASREAMDNQRRLPADLVAVLKQAFVQDAIGRAAALIGSARAYLYTSIGDLWAMLSAGEPPSPGQYAEFQMIHVHVFETCYEAVRLIYKVRGGSVVYAGNELDRCMRDILATNQYVVNSFRGYGAAGSALMGLPPEQILL